MSDYIIMCRHGFNTRLCAICEKEHRLLPEAKLEKGLLLWVERRSRVLFRRDDAEAYPKETALLVVAPLTWTNGLHASPSEWHCLISGHSDIHVVWPVPSTQAINGKPASEQADYQGANSIYTQSQGASNLILTWRFLHREPML